jgi:hypothetical protein
MGLAISASAQFQSDQLLVRATQGHVVYSVDHVNWRPLQPGVSLKSGAVLRTDTGATADVILKNCRTALRLAPESELEVARLAAAVVGNEVVADTVLSLKAGSVTGSQRKLAKLSRFDILFPGGAVSIHGTEYNVGANGTVACITGEVAVNGSAGASVKVPAGSALNSTTGKVGPASPELLASVQPAIDAVRVTAAAFAAPLTAVADNGNGNTSPNHGVGNGNGQGNDHQNGNGGGNGNGNANGNGNGNGAGPGTGNGQK